MAKQEYPPIGTRINEITGNDSSRDHYGPVSDQTSRFEICVDQTKDPLRRNIRILPKEDTRRDPSFPDTGILFDVTYDHDGNYLSIDALGIWRETDDNTEWYVEYTPDDEDPTIGRVTFVEKRVGAKNDRISTKFIEKSDWQEALGLASIPLEINIPDSVHRLVFGQDLRTGYALTDLAIQKQPLVPYISLI